MVATLQWLSCVRLFVTPWTPPHQASLFFTISQSLLKPMSIELVMPANHLIPCCFLRHLPSIFPSVRVFSNESALHIRWPKDWSFSTSPSSDYLGLMSFRIDWFDLLAVQGSVRLCLGKMRLNWSPVWQAGWSHVNFAEQELYLSEFPPLNNSSLAWVTRNINGGIWKSGINHILLKHWRSVWAPGQAPHPIVAQLCEGCSGLTGQMWAEPGTPLLLSPRCLPSGPSSQARCRLRDPMKQRFLLQATHMAEAESF